MLPASTTDAYRVLTSRLQACSGGHVLAVDVMGETLRKLDQPEEEVGGDIFNALVLMIRSGAVHCSTATPDRTEITIGTATILTPWRFH